MQTDEAGYITLARVAMFTVEQAISQAVESLPDELYRTYWIAAKYDHDPWAAVERWVYAHGNYPSDIVLLLANVLCLSQARQSLFNVVAGAEARQARPIPDLSLPRTRRPEK